MSSEGGRSLCTLLTGPKVGSGLSPSGEKGTPHLLIMRGSESETSNVGAERPKRPIRSIEWEFRV